MELMKTSIQTQIHGLDNRRTNKRRPTTMGISDYERDGKDGEWISNMNT